MARDITAPMLAEFAAPNNRPFVLLKFEFDSGDLNLWDGVGDLDWSGDTYIGAGNLLGISAVTETEAITANAVTFTLSGIQSDIISIALSEDYQGRPVSMWTGMFDADKAIVEDPVLIFSGSMDVMGITEGGDTAIVSVVAESQLRALTRSSSRKWTSADQKVIQPLDKGFDNVSDVANTSVSWEY